MSSVVDLTMDRGDDKTWEFTVLLDGTAVDITGASFRFMAKTRVSDTDGNAVVEATSANAKCVITDAANGVMEVRLVPADTSSLTETARLYYDLQMTESGGEVRTISKGLLEVSADVSTTVP